jgi:hypothetical protein
MQSKEQVTMQQVESDVTESDTENSQWKEQICNNLSKMTADITQREKLVSTLIKEGTFKDAAVKHQMKVVKGHFEFCLSLLDAK